MIPCRPFQFCETTPGECRSEEAFGTCTVIPRVCPIGIDVVCGCDGLTYVNACYADAAGVSVDHHGECETD